jgi:anti-sigma B factor antagonist
MTRPPFAFPRGDVSRLVHVVPARRAKKQLVHYNLGLFTRPATCSRRRPADFRARRDPACQEKARPDCVARSRSIELADVCTEQPSPSPYWRELNSPPAILISRENTTYEIGGEFVFRRRGITMKLVTEQRDGRTVLMIKEGRLDAHNSGELKDRILKLFEEGGRDLVVDLADVQFIDSSGLGALLSGHKNAIHRSTGFALVGLQPRVKAMFELTRLQRVFEIYPGLREALDA